MFWKKKKKSTANEGSGTNGERARSPHAVDWVSNAPSTWPVLQLEPLPSDNDALNTIMFGAGLVRTLERNPACGLKLSSMAQSILTPRGVAHVPIRLSDGSNTFCVFPLRRNSFEERARFWSVHAALAERGHEAFYFCPEELDEMPAVEDLPPLSFSDFERCEGDLPPGRWAIWTHHPAAEPNLDEFLEILERIYEQSEGIYSYLLGSMEHALSSDDEPLSRIAFPEELTAVPLTGPEGCPCIVTACAEKGIRFHFRDDMQDVEYLLLFLRQYARFVESVREGVAKAELPLDEPLETSPRDWCKLMTAAIRQQMQSGAELSSLGVIS
jgi:hypothetical protein